MTSSMIYWLITLPKIANGMGQGLLVVGFITISILGTLSMMTWSEILRGVKSFKKWFWVSVIMVIVGSLVMTFIPSTKEMVAIYAIPKVVNNEQVQQIPEKLLEYANLKLDDLIQSVPSKE